MVFLGSTPILLFSILHQILTVLADAFQQRYLNSKKCMHQRLVSTKRYRENGCIWTMLLCMWFLLVPPAQGLFLARNQSVVPAHHAAFNDISRQKFFGHGPYIAYSIFWQKDHYTGIATKDRKQYTKRSK